MLDEGDMRPDQVQITADDERARLSFLTLLIRMARIILERHTDYPIWQQMGKFTYFITVIPGGSKSALPLCQLNVRITPRKRPCSGHRWMSHKCHNRP